MKRILDFKWLSVIGMTASLLAPLNAWSVVDMKNANYAETFIDIQVPGTGYDLKIQRVYNSRSNFSGLFGYGWCTDFETKVEKLPEGGIRLQECGAGSEVVYYPRESDDKAIKATVDKIIAFYKKSEPNVQKQEILRGQLMTYHSLRVQWAKQAGLPTPELKKGQVFQADGLEVEKMTFDGQFYTRQLADGTMQKFDANGALAFIYDKNSNYIKVVYNGSAIKEVIDGNGRKLSFNYTNKRVNEIVGPGAVRASYTFKGEDLVQVKNMWKNTFDFAYDDVHNLMKITFPPEPGAKDRKFKALTYNKANDWVTSFADLDGCIEKYDYELDKENPRDHFSAKAVKTCGKEIRNNAKFEFWHKHTADGRKYLSRALTETNNDSLDVTYHPEFGRPLSIKQNGVVTTFTYYPNGLIQTKASDTTRLTYEYKNEYNKVSRVQTEYYDANKKVSRKRETAFGYDNKGNLLTAKNSDGQSVVLTYDPKGRIASIRDQSKKEVSIKYNEKFSKPAEITRPSVGTIKVSYKDSGEIDKVESKDGPTVAVQVAATFNNLLDIIAPATSELSL